MKKSKIISLLCLAMAVLPVWSQNRESSEIAEIALSYFQQQNTAKRTPLRIENLKHYEASDLLTVSGEKLSAPREAFTVYSLGEQSVIVSGDRRMPEILGYTDNGDFSQELPPNVAYWLSCYAEDYTRLQQSNVRTLAAGSSTRAKLPANAVTVSPLCKTKWGQSSPFYNLCPKYENKTCVTGCLATQMAQVMKYYEYPDCGTGFINYTSYSKNINVEFDFDASPFNWKSMANSYYLKNYTPAQAEAVANLMAACGAAIQMDYAPDGSGGSEVYEIIGLIDYLKYDGDMTNAQRYYFSDDEWESLVISELAAGHPIAYCGATKTVGHAFILHGCKPKNNQMYYDINWGWDGSFDGSFLLTGTGALSPGGTGTGGGAAGDAYTDYQSFTLGFIPENNTDNRVCSIMAHDVQLGKTQYNSGENIILNITLNQYYNFSYSTFKGCFVPKIYNLDGEEVARGSSEEVQYEFYDGENSKKIKFDTGGQLPDGVYTLKLFSYDPETDNLIPVAVRKGNPSFNVGDVNNKANLQVTSLELTEVAGHNVTLSYENLANLGASSFTGDLSLAVKDSKGNLTTVGEPVSFENLENNTYNEGTQTLSATLPESLATNKTHTLCLAAHEKGKIGWSAVKKYSLNSTGDGILKKDEDCSVDYYLAYREFSLSAHALALKVGESYTLEASEGDVKWTIKDSSVVTGSEGVVTAEKEGITTLICTAVDGVVDSCKVFVFAEGDIQNFGDSEGVQWATYNVGATMPAEAGSYFRISGSADKFSGLTFKEDNDSIGGLNWRLPSKDEVEELFDTSVIFPVNFDNWKIKGAVFANNGHLLFYPVTSMKTVTNTLVTKYLNHLVIPTGTYENGYKVMIIDLDDVTTYTYGTLSFSYLIPIRPVYAPQPDGIASPVFTTSPSAIYDLSGRPVSAPRGLHIVGGKKVLK